MTSSILPRVVRVIVRDLGANLTEQDLDGVTRLDDAMAMDSLGLLKFALGLEQEFGISLQREFFDREFLLNIPRLTAYLDTASP